MLSWRCVYAAPLILNLRCISDSVEDRNSLPNNFRQFAGADLLRTWIPVFNLIFVGVFFGLCLSLSWNSSYAALVSNLAAIIYIGATLVLFLKFASQLKVASNENSLRVSAAGIAGPLGILMASHWLGLDDKFFWVSDSLNTHHPSALLVLSILKGESSISLWQFFERLEPGSLTHTWVGFWYLLAGPTAFVSAIALLILKFVTGLAISEMFREMLGWFDLPVDGRIYLAATIFYLVPTVTFHTIVFYKEAMVHLAFAVTLLSVFRILKSHHFGSVMLLLLSLFAILIERFYVAATLLPVLFFVIWQTLRRRNVLAAALIFGAMLWAVSHYGWESYSFGDLVAKIKQQRAYHASFSDVSFKYNYEIPYLVALLKALFTPIWSPDKLALFTGLSTLITWGAFVHYFVILLYLAGCYRLARRGNAAQVLLFQVPLILFLIFAAYISPWAGRVRDSYYPLIAVFASCSCAIAEPRDWRLLICKLRWRALRQRSQ